MTEEKRSELTLKYFRDGGVLYGLVYTTQRGIVALRCALSTWFYRRVLARCGRGTVFRTGIYIAHPRRVEIGENSVIGDDVFLFCEVPGGRLEIGSRTKLWTGTLVDFSGGVFVGDRVMISSGVSIRTHDHGYSPHAKPVTHELVIGDEVWIGSGASILPRVRSIGPGAVIGAASVVTRAVPERAVVAGNPARIIGYTDGTLMDSEHDAPVR